MLALPWIALGLSLLAVAACAVCVWQVSQSLPRTILANLQTVQSNLEVAQTALEQQNGRLTAWRSEMEALYESVEGTLESVERKRRQTAAAASRLNGGAGPQVPEGPMDHDSLRQLARQQGFTDV